MYHTLHGCFSIIIRPILRSADKQRIFMVTILGHSNTVESCHIELIHRQQLALLKLQNFSQQPLSQAFVRIAHQRLASILADFCRQVSTVGQMQNKTLITLREKGRMLLVYLLGNGYIDFIRITHSTRGVPLVQPAALRHITHRTTCPQRIERQKQQTHVYLKQKRTNPHRKKPHEDRDEVYLFLCVP